MLQAIAWLGLAKSRLVIALTLREGQNKLCCLQSTFLHHDDRIYQRCVSSREHFGSIVRYLGASTVSTNTSVVLGHWLIACAISCAAFWLPVGEKPASELGDVDWVAVDALDHHLGYTEHVAQGADKWRADDVADVALSDGDTHT